MPVTHTPNLNLVKPDYGIPNWDDRGNSDILDTWAATVVVLNPVGGPQAGGISVNGNSRIGGSLQVPGNITGATWLGNPVADAYVVDALTINNGTINNTPIGQFVRQVGAFTALQANQLTVQPSLGTDVVSKFIGLAGQSGDLTQWINDSGTIMSVVSPIGAIGAKTNSPSPGTALTAQGPVRIRDASANRYHGDISTTSAGTVISSYDDTITQYRPIEVDSSSFLLKVGTSSTLTALAADISGNVAIGHASPAYRVDERGGIASFNPNLDTQNWATAALVHQNVANDTETEAAPKLGLRLLSFTTGAGLSFGAAPTASGGWKAGAFGTGQYWLSYNGATLEIQAGNADASSGTNPTTSPTAILHMNKLGQAGHLMTATEVTTVGAILAAKGTAKQLASVYDSTHYFYVQTNSTGATTLNIVGSTQTIAMGTGVQIQSGNFLSGFIGWNLTYDGNLEAENAQIRGTLRSTTFLKGEVLAVNGTIIVPKATTNLFSASFAVPGSFTSGVTTVTFNVKTDDTGAPYFIVADRVFMQVITATGTQQFRGVVSSVDNSHTASLYQGLTVFLITGTSTASTWYAGTAVVNYGQPGAGFISLSSDGTLGPSPNITMGKHSGAPWSGGDFLFFTRIGNLNGALGYSTDTYGAVFGNDLTISLTNPAAFKGMVLDPTTTNSLRLFNVAVTLYSSTNITVDIQPSGRVLFGSNTAAASTTGFGFFPVLTTYNSESMAAGSVLLGNNTAGAPNFLWDNSSLRLRNGTTTFLQADGTALTLTNITFNLFNGANKTVSMVPTGTSLWGTNVAVAASTSVAIFTVAQTYNSESMAGGAVLIGTNSGVNGNLLFTGTALQVRVGTTIFVQADSSGLTITNARLSLFNGVIQTVSITSTGTSKWGTDVSAPSTTTFMIAPTAITWGLEILGAGSVLTGPNTGPNMLWNGTDLLIRRLTTTVNFRFLGTAVNGFSAVFEAPFQFTATAGIGSFSAINTGGTFLNPAGSGGTSTTGGRIWNNSASSYPFMIDWWASGLRTLQIDHTSINFLNGTTNRQIRWYSDDLTTAVGLISGNGSLGQANMNMIANSSGLFATGNASISSNAVGGTPILSVVATASTAWTYAAPKFRVGDAITPTSTFEVGGTSNLGGATTVSSGGLNVSSGGLSVTGVASLLSGLSVTGGSTLAGGVAVTGTLTMNSGSVISLPNGNQYVTFGAAGIAIPTVSSRSGGTKIVLFENIGPTTFDFGFGISSSTINYYTATSGCNHSFWQGPSYQQVILRGDLLGNGGSTSVADWSTKNASTESFYHRYFTANQANFIGETWFSNSGAPGGARTGIDLIDHSGTNRAAFTINTWANGGGVPFFHTLISANNTINSYVGSTSAMEVSGGRTYLSGLTTGDAYVLGLRNGSTGAVSYITCDTSGQLSLTFGGTVCWTVATSGAFVGVAGYPIIVTGADIAAYAGGVFRFWDSGTTKWAAWQYDTGNSRVGLFTWAGGGIGAFNESTGTYTALSDRNLKTGFTSFDAISAIEGMQKIGSYYFKRIIHDEVTKKRTWVDEPDLSSGRYIGPMAQDIHGLGFGTSETMLEEKNVGGLALAGVQQLIPIVKKLSGDLANAMRELTEIRAQLAAKS